MHKYPRELNTVANMLMTWGLFLNFNHSPHNSQTNNKQPNFFICVFCCCRFAEQSKYCRTLKKKCRNSANENIEQSFPFLFISMCRTSRQTNNYQLIDCRLFWDIVRWKLAVRQKLSMRARVGECVSVCRCVCLLSYEKWLSLWYIVKSN